MAAPRTIEIKPISRVEGHGKVTLHLDEKGNLSRAHFNVTQLRGFEKFCEGRVFWEMPVITARICGICPVSHHLALLRVDGLIECRRDGKHNYYRVLRHRFGELMNKIVSAIPGEESHLRLGQILLTISPPDNPEA